HRLRIRRLAHHAGKAHARPMLALLARDLEEIGIQRKDVGLLRAAWKVAAQLLEHLAGGEFADLVEAGGVVGNCSLMKFIFAVRRKPAVSKPAGARDAEVAATLAGCGGGGAAIVSLPVSANCTGRGRSARRAARARTPSTIATASAASSRKPSRPLPPKR